MKKHAAGLLVAALVVAFGGGLALALDDPPDPTVVEDESVETTDDTTTDDTTTDDTVEDEESDESDGEESEIEEVEDADVEANVEGEHPENHGKYVSEAARETCAEAENHGECVREVARSDAGKPVREEDGGEEDGGEEEPAVAGAAASKGKAKGKQ